MTILPKIHIIFFTARARRATHRTHDTCTAQQKREVMTDDGSQPPIEQLATAVHRGSATRPLLARCFWSVLLGGVVVLLVFSAYCRTSRFLRRVSGKKHKNIRNIITVEVLIFNPNDPYISVHSKRGCVTLQHQTRDKMWITDRRLR